MKKIIMILLLGGLGLMLQGCYSNANLGLGTAIGNGGIINSNVQVGQDGHLYGNVGLGKAFRL